MTGKPIVLVDPNFRKMDEIFSPGDRERLYDTVEVVWGKDDLMPDDLAREVLADAVAAVCSTWRYGSEALYSAKNLRAMLTVSGGFPLKLDYDYCFKNSIHVLSAAPAFARQVAEMALGMALSACRDINIGDRAMRTGQEKYSWAGNVGTFMLYDQPVGMIGYGNLAHALQPLLVPFGCKISAFDPWLSEGYLRCAGVTPATLEKLLEESKVIFVLAIPTGENRALLSRALLEKIQLGAVLVLISRAHMVDFDALTELVLAGRIKAAIDVFPVEPVPLDHPIRQAEGAVLSAHRAGSVKEGLWEIGRMVVDDLEAIARGLPPMRMQRAEPELAPRYVTMDAKK
jgi:phosphoglycerate dehydrogenase-like enzyme